VDDLPEVDPYIIELIADGDNTATTIFVERYTQYVHHVAACVLGLTSSDIDDVAQETFLAAVDAIRDGRFDPYAPGSVRLWLGQIARRKALNVRRSRQPSRHVPLELWLMDHELTDGEERPDEIVAWREAWERCLRSLPSLPAHQHTVIWKRLKGWSDKEIAKEQGVEEGTIRTRYNRAVKELATLTQSRHHASMLCGTYLLVGIAKGLQPADDIDIAIYIGHSHSDALSKRVWYL
jgi:RNA polymerase sigma factor (sigma-70 family)